MTKFDQFKNSLKNKKCLVLGLGVSNVPLLALLNSCNVNKIKVCDKGGNTEAYRCFMREMCKSFVRDAKISDFAVGDDYLDNISGYDIVFKTPGMRFDKPELLKIKEEGAHLTTEMEEFMKVVPCKVFAVTGSDGKTTTTTLVSLMLERELEGTGRKVWVGGNIGAPLLDKTGMMKEDDIVVIELSSFQLMNTEMKPDVAIITNISENHLDWHKDYNEYIEAKKEIFKHQEKDSTLVVNHDDEILKNFVGNGITRSFSITEKVENGAYCVDDKIYMAKDGVETFIMDTSIIEVPGKYNVNNFITAITATMDYVSPETIRYVASTFKGVEHRIELVRDISGVKYYNSSIDSTPKRTIQTLSVFKDKSVILLAGGKDKNLSYRELGPVINKKVKTLIVNGPTASAIAESSRLAEGEKPEIIFASNYEEAIKIASQKAVKKDVVLLSPASTSFDAFKDFQERGELFKTVVKGL